MDGWMGGWMGVKAVLRIAYSNQQMDKTVHKNKKFGTEIRKKGNAGVEEWVGD
jgi:hypothetical protein